jgi:hypothetical protein
MFIDTTLKKEQRRKQSTASVKMYDPVLLDEIEEVFHDAHENFLSSFVSSSKLIERQPHRPS